MVFFSVAHPQNAVSDHWQKQSSPRVTVQQTPMKNAGLCVPDVTALVPAQVHATAVGSQENDALRSENAYLQQMIQQQKICAQTVQNEQLEALTQAAKEVRWSQREGFERTSEHYKAEARDVTLHESAQAVNQAEGTLHARYRQTQSALEGDLDRHEKDEAQAISQYSMSQCFR